MTIVDERGLRRRTGGPGSTPTDHGGPDPPVEADDVIRLGDVHVSELERLCVGESQ
jgi:hypothetical protein